MYILVAGGAGFVGSFLCDRLLDDGHKVLCVDNLSSGKKNNISKNIGKTNFTFFEHNIIHPFLKVDVLNLNKVEAIFHLASPASPNIQSKVSYMQHPIETMLVNSQGSYQLLELARKNKSIYIYASSSEVYGEPKEHPQNEKYFGNVNPVGPRSCYDEAKRFGESLAFSYFRKHKIDARIIRIFNTYGPRMDKDDGRVVSNFIVWALTNKPLKIYGDGSQTRSFCYISDLVEGLIKVLETKEMKGEVVNLGNNSEFTIQELAMLVVEILGIKPNIKYEHLPIDDPSRRKPDLQKAIRLLNYQPHVNLYDGLEKTIQYFKSVIK
jgi:nucleoside-diphosphate-sugar epimerase